MVKGGAVDVNMGPVMMSIEKKTRIWDPFKKKGPVRSDMGPVYKKRTRSFGYGTQFLGVSRFCELGIAIGGARRARPPRGAAGGSSTEKDTLPAGYDRRGRPITIVISHFVIS